MTINIAMIAGEPSGDLLGAGLIQALRQQHPDIVVSGIGGNAMIKAGCHSLYNLEELSVMGIVEPLLRLPRLICIRKNIFQHFLKTKPDVFIGIDAPDFNIGLELKLRQQGISTVHYVSPSVWAWRQKRIHKIAHAVDLMLALFPFEAQFYEKHNVPVQFVGHPLADKIPFQLNNEVVRSLLGLDLNRPVITLLPGSRRQELQHLGKVFLQAALCCHHIQPELQFITSSINADRDREWRQLHQDIAPQLPLKFFINRSHDVMSATDVILVTSGTATLESLLFKRPMVIAYKTSGFNYWLAKKLVKIPFIGLPNLLAQQAIVPEFIQDAVTPEKLAQSLLSYINNPQNTIELQEKFLKIHQQLAQKADFQAAKAILKVIKF